MLACPALETLDQRIAVREMVRNHECRLRSAWLDQQVAGGERSEPRAVAANQTQRQIDMRQGRAGGYEPSRRDQHAGLIESDARVSLAKQGRQPPGSRGTVTVEKRAVGQHESARAGRSDPRAILRPLA